MGNSYGITPGYSFFWLPSGNFKRSAVMSLIGI